MRENGGKGEEENVDLGPLIHKVIGCLIEVHRTLGPGILEGVYRRAVEIEFRRRGIRYETEKEISPQYRGEPLGIHRLDLLVEGMLVVELKTVEELHKKHYAQVRSYLKAVGLSLGLLVNFAAYPIDVRRVEVRS